MTFQREKKGKMRIAAFAIAIVMAIGMLAGVNFASGSASALSPYDYPGGAKGKFYTDYASYAEQQAAALEHNIKTAEESFTLFKNTNSTLPLAPSANNITLFSSASYPAPSPVTRITQTSGVHVTNGLIWGGTGSGAGAGDSVTLPAALQAGGFNLNPRPFDIYERTIRVEKISNKIGGLQDSRVEIPIEYIADEINVQGMHTDAFIATVARIAGEGGNLWQGGDKNATKRIVTNADIDKHYLQLDDSEIDLLNYMKGLKAENKAKGINTPIIYLINSATPFEMTQLEDDPEVDAILWIGFPGVNGLSALPKILKGEVNPSGRTVDIYPADFFNDPASVAFWGDKLPSEMSPDPVNRPNRGSNDAHEEDIYMGYKWYETAYADGVLDQTPVYDAAKAIIPADKAGQADEVYYNRSTGVVYPFGYGLSYTEFEQEIVTTADDLKAQIDGARGLDTMVNLRVKVKNTGAVAGKEVVQLYVSAPYTPGGIEKAEVQLASFAKTKLLNSMASETLTLKVRLGDIASFDFNDANNNGFKGWEIEAGNYDFRIQKNSHEVCDSLNAIALNAHTTDLYDDVNVTLNGTTDTTPLSNTTKYKADGVTPYYSDKWVKLADANPEVRAEVWDNNADKWDSSKYSTVLGGMETFSRVNLVATYPGVAYAGGNPNGRGRALDCYFNPAYTDFSSNSTNPDKAKTSRLYTEFDDKPTDLWYKTTADIPATWTQRETAYAARQAPIQLKDMAGLDYNDTSYTLELGVDTNVAALDGKTPAEAWVLFMNQLTYKEMADVLFNGGFRTLAIDSIGKLLTLENDGPACLNYDSRRVTYTQTGATYSSSQGLRGTFWVSEINVAATWNVDLARRQGTLIGNEALFANCTGWYAPGVQLHNSPFIGRNFEYYSQDGLQGGFIAAAIVGGAQSKGINVYLKHWGFISHLGSEVLTEQNLRETHLKPYEYAVKFGNATGMMACSNFGTWSGTSNYALNQQLAYTEWGFKGAMITDWYGTYAGYANYNQRTGVTIPLNAYSTGGGADNKINGYWDATGRSGNGMLMENKKYVSGSLLTVVEPGEEIAAPNTWYYTREAVRNLLWMSANTAANYNGLDKSKVPNTVSGTNQTALDTADKVIDLKRGLNYVSANLPTTASTNQIAYFGLDTAETAAFGTSYRNYYEVVSGTLPAGLSLDYKTGRIVGTTTANPGVTNITVRVLGDGWFRVNYTVLVRISDLLTPSAALNATENTAFSSQFSQDMFTVGGDYNGYPITALGNYSIVSGTGVPGLSMAADGTLSGTPSAAGTYNVTVRLPVTYTTTTSRTANIDTTYTVVVAAAPAVPAQQWLSGADIPAAGLGNLGDMYFNIANGDVYSKADVEGTATWTKIGSIAGDALTATAVNALITAAMNANAKGFLDETAATTLINSLVNAKGYQTAANVTTAITAAMDANAKGFLTNTTATTLINSLVDAKGFQKAADVTAAITAAMNANAKGFLTDATATTLINSLVDAKGFQKAADVTAAINTVINANAKGFIDETKAKALIAEAAAGNLTEADIQKMIDESIKADGGCKSASASIVALISLLAMAFIVIIKKQRNKAETK